MNTEAKPLLHASCEENQPDKVSYFKPVDGSPFTRVCQGNKYFMVMGDFRISPPFDTEDELSEYFEGNMYNNILSMITVVIAKQNELNANKTQA